MWKTLSIPENNSKVTLELRELIESGVKIWDFEYPSFYTGPEKAAFEQKVIDHYYFRQIGQETPARFLHYFRSKIREIMPYYIKRYESVKLMEDVGDPFEAYNLTETYEETRTGSARVNGTSSESASSEATGTESKTISRENEENKTGESLKKIHFSDTPHGRFDNEHFENYLTTFTGETFESLDKDTVAEDITENGSSGATNTSSASSTSEHSSEDSGTVSHTLTRRGNIGVQPLGQEINAYRSALINVDLEIIEELNELFLLVY